MQQQLEKAIRVQIYPNTTIIQELDEGFDKKRDIIENFMESDNTQQQQILEKARQCDYSDTESSKTSDGCSDPDQKTRRNLLQMIDYNKNRIRKSSKDQKSNKRYAETYLRRFKHKIKRKLELQHPVVDIKYFNYLPGMKNQSWHAMIDLLQTSNNLSKQFSFKSLSQQYTSSHQILLDVIFPIFKKSGNDGHKLKQETTQAMPNFFSSYQIMSKCFALPGVKRNDLSFVNCRHYNTCTTLKYNNFQEDKKTKKKK